MEYVSFAKIKEKYQISPGSLRKWADEERVRIVRTPGGKRLYNFSDVAELFGDQEEPKVKEKICYARVSSNHQKEDLERQIEKLQEYYPNHRIIKDIGSGVNFKRRGFKTLLDLCFSGSIDEIVVTYKDRLCRFGFEILELIFQRFKVRLVVLSKEDKEIETSPEQELSEDLLSLVTIFVAKNNGLRAGANRRAKSKKAKTLSNEGDEGED